MTRKTITALIISLASLFIAVPIALAVGESATVNYNVVPIKKKFSAKGFQPAQLSWGVQVTPQEGAVTILPMRQADMRFPSSKTMFFQPAKKVKPCRVSSTLLVGPAETIYTKCPSSVVGNGQATFQLGQSTSPLAFRKGTVVVLYGGKAGKDTKLLFSAWSGDTNAGVVATGILRKTGRMVVQMPVLTADSAVTSLNLSIPGKNVSGTWGSGNPYSLRAGSDSGFVRVKCRSGQTLTFGATLLLGARKQDGSSYGPTETIKAQSSSRCGK